MNDLKDKFATGRGKETLFRVTARNQIELIAIADNKANIVIGINVLLITVVLAIFGSDLQTGDRFIMTRMELVIPFGILLFTSLLSAVFAMLAAKPNIIKPKSEASTSKLFFQNFYRETLEEYFADMYEVLSSREKTYRQMIIDMYYNGIVLKEKYSLLSRSYNILMFGLVASVVAYLVTVSVS